MADNLELTQVDSKKYLDDMLRVFTRLLDEEKTITLLNFGIFYVTEKSARKSYNPITKKYIKLPKRMILNFRPSQNIRQKFKNKEDSVQT